MDRSLLQVCTENNVLLRNVGEMLRAGFVEHCVIATSGNKRHKRAQEFGKQTDLNFPWELWGHFTTQRNFKESPNGPISAPTRFFTSPGLL